MTADMGDMCGIVVDAKEPSALWIISFEHVLNFAGGNGKCGQRMRLAGYSLSFVE